jgi:hypothetical protein
LKQKKKKRRGRERMREITKYTSMGGFGFMFCAHVFSCYSSVFSLKKKTLCTPFFNSFASA